MIATRTPPPLLEGPLTITLEGEALDTLNRYRQSYHAWSMHPGFGDKGESLNRDLANAASDLSKALARLVR